MVISVEKLYEFLDSTTFLNQGDILELLYYISETGATKVKWHGEVYDLSADETESKVTKEKTGKWIDGIDSYNDLSITYCSLCHEKGLHKWKVCPNCEARMIDTQESEEV